METHARYQVFISSTYEDLREERQQVTQAILEAGNFPSGMELFPASDDSQWELIKRVILECDYYVVVVAGKYGTIPPSGKSYTEAEYDFAIENGIPVLGFVRSEIGDLTARNVETDAARVKMLSDFRAKVMSRGCRKYTDPGGLGMAVLKSLMFETRVRPRIGWVRADQAISDADRQREIALLNELKAAEQRIADLERELRDQSMLSTEIPRENLAQGDDTLEISVSFRNKENQPTISTALLTWDEIFQTIGPQLFGYILRKAQVGYRGPLKYAFEDELESRVRSKIVDQCGGRKIELNRSEIDTIVFQFKELGLIRFVDKKDKGKEVFRGITLTEAGERKLTKLKTNLRST